LCTILILITANNCYFNSRAAGLDVLHTNLAQPHCQLTWFVLISNLGILLFKNFTFIFSNLCKWTIAFCVLLCSVENYDHPEFQKSSPSAKSTFVTFAIDKKSRAVPLLKFSWIFQSQYVMPLYKALKAWTRSSKLSPTSSMSPHLLIISLLEKTYMYGQILQPVSKTWSFWENPCLLCSPSYTDQYNPRRRLKKFKTDSEQKPLKPWNLNTCYLLHIPNGSFSVSPCPIAYYVISFRLINTWAFQVLTL